MRVSAATRMYNVYMSDVIPANSPGYGCTYVLQRHMSMCNVLLDVSSLFACVVPHDESAKARLASKLSLPAQTSSYVFPHHSL